MELLFSPSSSRVCPLTALHKYSSLNLTHRRSLDPNRTYARVYPIRVKFLIERYDSAEDVHSKVLFSKGDVLVEHVQTARRVHSVSELDSYEHVVQTLGPLECRMNVDLILRHNFKSV